MKRPGLYRSSGNPALSYLDFSAPSGRHFDAAWTPAVRNAVMTFYNLLRGIWLEERRSLAFFGRRSLIGIRQRVAMLLPGAVLISRRTSSPRVRSKVLSVEDIPVWWKTPSNQKKRAANKTL